MRGVATINKKDFTGRIAGAAPNVTDETDIVIREQQESAFDDIKALSADAADVHFFEKVTEQWLT